jgi:nicotinamide-nucleotide adenylyltransferase
MVVMTNALFVGRFQPLHLGHLRAVEEILRHNDHVIIIIGSARQHDTKENPFSLHERTGMIRDSLRARGIRDFEIGSLHDYNDDKLWTGALKKAYEFDAVYSQNPWTLECFKRNGVRVKRHMLYQKRKYSGVNIRKMIAEGKEWRDLVPPEVRDSILKVKGEERIRRLFQKGS